MKTEYCLPLGSDYLNRQSAIETGATACSQRKEKAEREETQSREPPQVYHGRHYREVFPRLLLL